MGSVVNIIMGSRWAALATLLALSLAQVTVEATMWSNIGFMTNQDQAPANKRSAEDAHELSVDDMDLSASETHYDSVPYNDLGLSSSGDAESRVEPMRRRKYRRRRRKNRYENLVVPSQDYEATLQDNQLYDRDSSYKAPSANYAAPEPTYEAPSYSSYEAPKYEPNYTPSYEGYSGGAKDSFNDFLNALAAFLPIGLFLAAIPPNLIVINSRRKRSTDEEDYNSVETVYPSLEKINKIGFEQLNDVKCQKELFCEMVVMGNSKEANFVQRSMAAMVHYTPTFVANTFGMKKVLQATENKECHQFKCL